MKTMKEKIEAVRIEFERKKQNLTIADLITYPEGTLGKNLGTHLMQNSYGKVVPEKEDIYQLLISRGNSLKQEIAVQFYLFGNGCTSLNILFSMAVGLAMCPFYLGYFYQRYKEGKHALRFYDVDHFGMLHLPVARIKDAFLIR
jgi:hypothetical protein